MIFAIIGISLFILISKSLVKYVYNRIVYSKIHSGIYTPYQYTLTTKKEYHNLSDKGQIAYLNTYFVSPDIHSAFHSVVNAIYKQTMLMDDDNHMIREASKAICNDLSLLMTDDLNYNAYLIVGKNEFHYKPSREHNVIIQIPVINPHSLAVILTPE